MRRISPFVVGLLGALLPVCPAFADPPAAADAPVRVAAFDGDRAAAISYTFDDDTVDHYRIVAPMFEAFGLRATFFVIAGTVPDTDQEAAARKPGQYGGVSWPQLKAMAEKGHEIANHSWTHMNLRKCSDDELREQIEKSRAVIAEKVGAAPLTFCYPGNGRDERVRQAVLKTHIAAREYQFEIGGTDMTAARANAWADDVAKQGKWGVSMTHGILNGYHPLSSPDVLREHLAYVSKCRDRIWIDTFANVARYVRERDTARVAVETKTAREALFVVDSELARPPFDYPLTIVIEAPGARQPKASRDGQALPATVSGTKILVRAAPDPKPIRVAWE